MEVSTSISVVPVCFLRRWEVKDWRDFIWLILLLAGAQAADVRGLVHGGRAEYGDMDYPGLGAEPAVVAGDKALGCAQRRAPAGGEGYVVSRGAAADEGLDSELLHYNAGIAHYRAGQYHLLPVAHQ